MAPEVTAQAIWRLMLVELEKRGHHFEKIYRIEVTWNEIIVWHDQYKDGHPVMDKDRKIVRVTKTRIEV